MAGFTNKRGDAATSELSRSLTIVSTDSPYSPVNTDYTILANAASGAITVNLPAAANSNGRIFNIKKIDSSGNAVTVDASGSELIDGQLTNILVNQYDSIQIQCNGSNWYII